MPIDQNALGLIVSPRIVDTYFPAYIAHTEHIAEIIKRWFVIVLFLGCVERAWNLYSWACSQTAGTDSTKAPLGLTCLRRFRTAPLSIRGSNIKNVRRVKKKKKRCVPISPTDILNSVYHLASHRGRMCRFDAEQGGVSVQHQQAVRSLWWDSRAAISIWGGTTVQGEVEIEHVALIDAREHGHTHADTHKTSHSHTCLQEYAGSGTLSSLPPADRQMARVTLSRWHGGAYNLKPCLHLKIHQDHIDVQYTSCQPGPSRLQWALDAVQYA